MDRTHYRCRRGPLEMTQRLRGTQCRGLTRGSESGVRPVESSCHTARYAGLGWYVRSKSSACPRVPCEWDPIHEYLSVNPQVWTAVQPALFKHVLTMLR